jgi:folate-binding protein YgfZ
MQDIFPSYTTLTTGAGWIDFRRRTQVECTGADRARFLHNLCTNDVLRMQSGEGCEAFMTNIQGKIVAHVFLFCNVASIVIETVPGQAPCIVAHLERYIIRDDVQLHDRTDEWDELFLAGAQAARVLHDLAGVAPREARLSHCAVELHGVPASVRRVDLVKPEGFLIQCSNAATATWTEALTAAGAVPCDDTAFDTLRIEAGTPLFGQDITAQNFPQEVARDEMAISFRKGCYLGQETVARIDALGHVNQMLCKVRMAGNELPPVGTELTSEGKKVGHVTSVTHSPELQATLALAYVRRGKYEPGTILDSVVGTAQVIGKSP